MNKPADPASEKVGLVRSRTKQEERLSALASQREMLEARVMDQELACESSLDELDASLQVSVPCSLTSSPTYRHPDQ
jgi:hypothetical protein